MMSKGCGWLLLALLLASASCRKPSGESPVSFPEEDARLKDRSVDSDVDELDPRELVRSAYDEALTLDDVAERQRAMAGVAWDAIELDPELAQQAFDQLQTGSEESKQLIGHFVMRLAAEDGDAAVEWARSLEDSGERSEALGRVAVVLANTDPQAAGEIVIGEMEAGRARDRSTVQVVQRWSQAEPKAALDWAVSLESRPARQAGMKEAVARWMAADDEAVAVWLSSVDEGRLRSEGVLATAEVLLRLAPEDRRRFLDRVDQELRGLIEARVAHAAAP